MSDRPGTDDSHSRLERAGSARSRADLVSGLRGLTRRSAAPPDGRSQSNGSAAPSGAMPVEGAQIGSPADAAAADEFCELCGAPLPPDHRHLLHLDERRMLCACETCWSVRSGEASYRPSGVRIAWLENFELPNEAWASFQIPIGLAFFMRTGDRIVAFYPSPAGATESDIDEAAWRKLEVLNPPLSQLEPDCEALIVDRMGDQRRFVIAPIDECYRLVGMIKMSWDGISGGPGPEAAIDRFFAQLRIRGATMARTDV